MPIPSVQIEIEFEYPQWVKSIMLKQLPSDEARKAVIRPAVRTALSPLASELRRITRAQSKASPRKQGSGATSRAVIIKVGAHQKEKGVVYGIVGINRRWFEVMSNTSPTERRGKFRTIAGEANFRRDARNKRKIRGALKRLAKTKEVTSYYKASFSAMKRRKSSVVKRVPVRYFHLVDKGFQHFSGVRGRPHNMLQQAYNAKKQIVIDTFMREIRRRAYDYMRRKGIPIK